MRTPHGQPTTLKSAVQVVTHEDYRSLAAFLEVRERTQRVHKKESHSKALRAAAEKYENREYVAAYECLKPVYDKVAADMQRVLARNVEFEANKLAKELQKPLAIAKKNIASMRAHAQQILDKFNLLRQDLEYKPLVKLHIKKGAGASSVAETATEIVSQPALNGTAETQFENENSTVMPGLLQSNEIVSGNNRYRKTAYSPPEKQALYCVRDKSQGDRVIRVIALSPDGRLVQVEPLDDTKPAKKPIQLSVESLERQAQKGWCNRLLPVVETAQAFAQVSQPVAAPTVNIDGVMRLDIQNFGRCCSDIVRANIKFDTQLIKDVGDGPFRAGNYEQAFLTFEQFAGGFSSAVGSSRRSIADGRRTLTSEKGKLSGKEIQERTAAFIRSEQLINTAEREFSTILEGLRMYLRSKLG